jgi:hypothetical protein
MKVSVRDSRPRHREPLRVCRLDRDLPPSMHGCPRGAASCPLRQRRLPQISIIQLNDAEYSVRYSLQILLYESWTEMDVELHERRFANVLEAVHLACLDHEDVGSELQHWRFGKSRVLGRTWSTSLRRDQARAACSRHRRALGPCPGRSVNDQGEVHRSRVDVLLPDIIAGVDLPLEAALGRSSTDSRAVPPAVRPTPPRYRPEETPNKRVNARLNAAVDS